MAHPKGLLIELAQKLGLERPDFNTAKTGPEHEPSFLSDVVIEGEVLGTGQGHSKRDAEKAAAEEALAALERRENSSTGKSGVKKGAAEGGAAGTKSRGGQRGRGRTAAPAAKTPKAGPQPALEAAVDPIELEDDDLAAEFTGPWPMFEGLLGSVVEVAERRVSADLRGDKALAAIHDFSVRLYKGLLADLGEVVEEDEDEED